MPRVSIVMAAYNAAAFLQESVGSILAQTVTDFELIVVDDASTDATATMLKQFADPRLRVITLTRNGGAANARNQGLATARGDYIAIMDADDVSSASRIEIQADFLDRHPEIALVGAAVYDNIDIDGCVLHTSYLPEESHIIASTLRQKWCCLHSSLMFRREVVDRVGGYRPELDAAEDHDFILRILDHYRIRNLNSKLVSYRINPSGLSVVRHKCINQLGEVAMHLARQRREDGAEDLAAALEMIAAIKKQYTELRFVSRLFALWQDSLYAASRYYGFGSKELCGGNLARARKCFVRSLRCNAFFIRSWIGLLLSFFPAVADRLKFLFRASIRYHQERSALRGGVAQTTAAAATSGDPIVSRLRGHRRA
jgi:glycosyltransferase involved in cell wall biosynthesis